MQLQPATWLPLWVGHVACQVVSPFFLHISLCLPLFSVVVADPIRACQLSKVLSYIGGEVVTSRYFHRKAVLSYHLYEHRGHSLGPNAM
jgi:hypothetical protein